MNAIARPSAAYALVVFCVGFVLGTARVLVIAPLIGEGAAVLLELPIMIAVSYHVARWAVGRWQVAPRLGPRLLMGAVAFALLMICEGAISLTLFANSWAQHLTHYLEPLALAGLAAQVAFAAVPALLLATKPR